MAQIRQEINILDHVVSATTAVNDVTDSIIQIDTTQYNGTVSYYLEVVGTNTSSVDRSVILRSGASQIGPPFANIPASSSSNVIARSGDLSGVLLAGANNYYIRLGANASGTLTVKSARIVIIQNATTLTNTETQIEIGNYNTARTTEVSAILTNPKYWKYDASKWDGTKTFYAEAVYDSGDMDTVSVYLYESAAIDAPSWSSVATIVSAATTTVPTRTRVAFTPTDGRWYTIFSLNGSMDNHDIYSGKIVVTSTEGIFNPSTPASSENYQGGTGATSNQAQAQKFILGAADTITGVKLYLKKTGSPTDTTNVDIVSTLGGSSLANGTISNSSLTTSLAQYTITFGTPFAVTANTTYYIQLTRSPDSSDTTNYPSVGKSFNTYGPGGVFTRSNNSWGAELTGQVYNFELQGVSSITKLEPQYLLANTLFAAGTALQTFLTDWDSTEWDDGGGSITYYFQAEAANGSTSDVTLEQADGGGTVTNSTLTNIDNAQISSAMTMPGDENLDTKATTNAGDVAAARILVAYVFSAALSGSLKTKKGLALASVKTFKGLATASVKTDKGLALT